MKAKTCGIPALALTITTLGLAALIPGCGGGGGGGGGGSAGSSLALLAGDIGGRGNVDGAGAAARFNFLSGVGTDSAGNVYVADAVSSTIRKITPAGAVSTFAGTPGNSGSLDGPGAAASFSFPKGVAVDSLGNVYVADSGNRTVRKITPGGTVTTFAGAAGQSGINDSTIGTQARFNFPNGIATDTANNVYIADASNNNIRKITPAGAVTTFAGSTAGTPGSTDATGTAASFNVPAGVSTDTANNVYVADLSNNTIRMITPGGVVSTISGAAGVTGTADGPIASARFNSPQSIAVDSANRAFVADTGSNTVRMISGGVVSTLAGTPPLTGSNDATGAAARFRSPTGIAVDSAFNVYVADDGNHTVRKIVPATGAVSTFAGSPPLIGSTDASGSTARFNEPFGVCADAAGNAYVTDTLNHTVRKITPAGAVSTFAGTAGAQGSADGTGALANFRFPQFCAFDTAGNLYVSDSNNHTIRKITPGGVVSTLAGLAGQQGSTDALGAAARFKVPSGIAVDSAGNVYVADSNNFTVRKITPGGSVSTLAGTVGVFGNVDATTTAAKFGFLDGVAVDSAGNVFVADGGNNTIRKIDPGGVVTTFAGTGPNPGSADGTGAAARFNSPTGIAVDSADNLYVADLNNSVIRKITPAGVVTTVVGVTGQADFTPGALPGRLAFPGTVAVSGGSLYITFANGVAVVQNRP